MGACVTLAEGAGFWELACVGLVRHGGEPVSTQGGHRSSYL
jgi:hypothetical protein